MLKLRMQRVMRLQGYACPVEVELSDYEYDESRRSLKRTALTDIDVLGIRFEPDLRQQVAIADCKSGKESESNRLFWIRGVMDFFGADSGTLVKTRVRGQAKALAPKLGVRVLDEPGLAVLEQGLGVQESLPASAEANYRRLQALWGIEVPAGRRPTQEQLEKKKAYHYLQYLYWMLDEYRNTQSVLEHMRAISSRLDAADERDAYLCFVALQRLTLSVLRVASEVLTRGGTDVMGCSKSYLFGGPVALRERKQIIEMLNEVRRSAMLVSDDVQLEPAYFDELVEIVNKTVGHSGSACKMLLHAEAATLHLFAGAEDLETQLGSHFSLDALVLLKRLAKLLQVHAGLHADVFRGLHEM